MRWDVVISDSARDFLTSLIADETRSCTDTILNQLCDGPDPANNPERIFVTSFPNRPDTIECDIGAWHFRYRILNANTIGLATISFSPYDPRHPFHDPSG